MTNDTRLSEAKQKLLELQRRGRLAHAPFDSTERKTRSAGEPVPLSPAQEQVWRLDQTAGKLAPLHNESITIHRRGPCDVTVLEKAFVEIIRRHEIWRTTFEVRDGCPVQIVHPPPTAFNIPTTDLRSSQKSKEPSREGVSPDPASGDSREEVALELATQDARLPFDLSRGPLLRARLVTLSDDEHRLFLTAHQSIVDGVTVYDVFPTELTTLYESFASGKPSPLPELEIQFADFACGQRLRLTEAVREQQLAYWQQQLAGSVQPLEWPDAGARPPKRTFRGAIHPFALDMQLSESIRELGRREGTTLFMILLAGLVTLLQRYSHQDEIIIGTLSPSGRKGPEFQRLLGYFLNPVPLRTNLSGNPTFSELLRQVRDVTLGAISNDDLPLETIAERLCIQPDPARNLFFTVALSVAPDVAPLPAGWSMTFMDVESGGSRWDLYLELSDRADGMMGRAQYNSDIFSEPTIQQTIEDLGTVLRKATGNPALALSELSNSVGAPR